MITTDLARLDLTEVWQRYRRLGLVVVVASLLLNVILFAGSIYMMLVYDSVLPSQSLPTLFGLFGLLLVLYAFQAVFETIRSEAMLSLANALHGELYPRVHFATGELARRGATGGGDGMQLVRDLDQIHAFLTGPGPIALIDLPWVIVFLAVLTSLHWALGLTAVIGTIVLILVAVHTNRQTSQGSADLVAVLGVRAAATLQEIRFVESARALGMRERLFDRTVAHEGRYVDRQSVLSRLTLRLGSFSRILRMVLQSLLLTVGAMLVMAGEASGGVILASSVLSGRALAPVDTAIGNWRGLVGARSGRSRLREALAACPRPALRAVKLPPPSGRLEASDLWLAPPGSSNAVVAGASLTLDPGQVLAIIGPSAAGKTSLAKALAGVWAPSRGVIRIGGATYDQWDAEDFGRSVGYVPQSVDLLDGTVGENIARFIPDAPSDQIIAAARAAGLHETILALSNGYDTRLSASGGELSAGQRQRLGLARALFGDPFLVVLDEANSNLDADGDAALARAVEDVKARQGIVVMVTHRPATLGPVTHVLVMDRGRVVNMGPRDEVLARLGLTREPAASRPGARPGPVAVP